MDADTLYNRPIKLLHYSLKDGSHDTVYCHKVFVGQRELKICLGVKSGLVRGGGEARKEEGADPWVPLSYFAWGGDRVVKDGVLERSENLTEAIKGLPRETLGFSTMEMPLFPIDG